MRNSSFWNNFVSIRLHYLVFQDKESEMKLKWLKANEHKKYFWSQWISMSVLKSIGKNLYAPDTDEMVEWMIKERTVAVVEKRICFNPRAFCWDSGKRLFLKPVTVVHTLITGPGDPLKEKFYFDPKQYTLWLLKNK